MKEAADATTPQNAGTSGVGLRPSRLYTGAERPFDPEDLVMAMGGDVTPDSVKRAEQLIEAKGSAALERYLP